jgi:hypothetical protein
MSRFVGRRGFAALGVLAVGCGGGGGGAGSIEQQQIGTPLAANLEISGTSLSDVWALASVFDKQGLPIVGVGHTTGGRLWQTIALPQLKSTLPEEGFSSGGNGTLWMGGLNTSLLPTFLRVNAGGTVDDFIADLPVSPPNSSASFSIKAGHGGVFAAVSVRDLDAGTQTAKLLRLQGEHLIAVAAFPDCIEARVLEVVGTDEAYLWLNEGKINGKLDRFVHYSAGVFADVAWQGPADLLDVAVSARSPTDVWIWIVGDTQAGSTIQHGDGTNWTAHVISGWPKDTGFPFYFVPLDLGRSAVIAQGLMTQLGASVEIDEVALDASANVTSKSRVGACADRGDCALGTGSTFRLDDGTLLFVTHSGQSWLVGNVSAL